MNKIFVEQEIRKAIKEQAEWEAFEVPDAKLTRMAENVVSRLGLTQFSDGAVRWWSTKYYEIDE